MNISDATYLNLGHDKREIERYHKDLISLKASVPCMCLAEPTCDFSFSQELDKSGNPIIESLYKGKDVLMSLFFYGSLEYDRQGKRCLLPSVTKFKDVYKPYNGQDLTNKKILVWRSGGIGDLLFIQPHIKYLKQKYPSCNITFSTSKKYIPLIKKWKFVDDVVSFPISKTRFEENDYHITFEGVIERCEAAHSNNAYELFRSWLCIDTPNDQLTPNLSDNFFKNVDKKISKFMHTNNLKTNKFILVQLQASSPIRTPSSTVWFQILEPLLKQNYKIVISDSPAKHKYVEKFIKHLLFAYRKNIFNFCKESEDINYSISLAKQAKLIIATDSSFIHIAAGVNKPVFGIYGAFCGSSRMSTYTKADWIEPPNTNCCAFNGKHCFIHGHEPCAFSYNNPNNLFLDQGCSPCYEYIDFGLVNEKILKLMRG